MGPVHQGDERVDIPGLEGDSLRAELQGSVATLTMNRPMQHNALSRELRRNLTTALRAARTDDRVRVVILTGAGERSFSVGADFTELAAGMLTPDEVGVTTPLMQAFAALGKPTIAAVNGFAVTGGFELALNCGIILASRNAQFADTHSRVGVMSSLGLTQNLLRAIGPVRTRYLSLTGRYIDAATARDWGLVVDVFDQADLLPKARAIASDIVAGHEAVIADMERSIRFGNAHTLEAGLAFEEPLARASLLNFDFAAFASEGEKVKRRGRDGLRRPSEDTGNTTAERS